MRDWQPVKKIGALNEFIIYGIGMESLTCETLFQKMYAKDLQDPLPLPPLNGLNCIVTGATSGIGLEIDWVRGTSCHGCEKHKSYPSTHPEMAKKSTWLEVLKYQCFRTTSLLSRINCNICTRMEFNIKTPFIFSSIMLESIP